MAKSKRRFLTPEQAIKAMCLDCANGQKKEVELCPVIDCPLWSYRRGFDKKELPVDRSIWDEVIEMEV